jgi:hypothetical protein
MRTYTVSPEFKTQVTEILSAKKFTAVFPFMNLVNREGFQYNEQELNQLIQFMGEFPYNEVAEFFQSISKLVTENGLSSGESQPEQEFAPVASEEVTA